MKFLDTTEDAKIEDLVGKIIKDVTGLFEGSSEVHIFTECGCEYLFHHHQDCCEDVALNDFEGDTDDVVGGLILNIEVVTNVRGDPPPDPSSEEWTWTFYKIETDRGGLWMRWFGESNGYYSEEVDFSLVEKSNINQLKGNVSL